MSNIIFNKTKQKTGDVARKFAKAAREEVVEVKKSAVQQIAGYEQAQGQSPIVEAMRQGVVSVSDEKHEDIHHDEKRRLDYLDKELEGLRRKRKWEEEQKQIAAMQHKQDQTENKLLKPLEIPTSKPKRGLFGVKKKQGTKEKGKQVSG